MGEYTTVADFDRKTRKAIKSVLGDRERFVLAIDCRDAFLIGKTRRATKLVLTDHRLIVFSRGFIRQRIRDFPRDGIASIEFEKGLVFGNLVINGRRTTDWDELTYRVYAESGRRFATQLRQPDPPETDHPQSITYQIYNADPSRANTAAPMDVEMPVESDPVADDTPRDPGTPDDQQSEADEIPVAAEIDPGPEPASDSRTAEEPPAATDTSTGPSATTHRENWHYATIAAFGVILVDLVAIQGLTLAGLGVLALAVTLYFDMRYVSTVSEWHPRTWLYIPGAILLAVITVPYYLYRRHTTVGL